MTMLNDELKNLAVELSAELDRAREKFPSAKNLGWALLEETGELAKAVLHQDGVVACRKEAIQVMAVAYRIITEGDASLDISEESQQE
jgi:NTP pyrophosphatase (non-canonical NTP hydrolase)